MNTILEIQNLEVDYDGVRALQGVSLRAERGTITALVGANGAGKTTLLRAISGIVRAQTGMITFGGRQIQREAPHAIVRQGIAHVPEGRRVFATATVRQAVRVVARTASSAAAAASTRAIGKCTSNG